MPSNRATSQRKSTPQQRKSTPAVSPGIVLIGTPISHYVQTLILVCEEKGIPYRLQVDGHDTPAALDSDAHRRWHPFGKIPALQHGAIRLYETSAIGRYLDLAFAGPALVPAEPLAAARMEQWISSVNSYFHGPCISQLVGQYVFPRGPGGEPDRAVIDAAETPVRRALRTLDSACAAGPYLAGDHLSLADLFVLPLLLQLQRTPEGRAWLADCDAIARYLQPLAARRSLVTAMAQLERHLPAGHRLGAGNPPPTRD